MKDYMFKTSVTMKPYNNKRWYVDSSTIGDITISANNIDEALKEYQSFAKEYCYVNISDNALKTKEVMYRDNMNGESFQSGYIMTGSTTFQDNETYKITTQYVDCWTEILEVKRPDEFENC